MCSSEATGHWVQSLYEWHVSWATIIGFGGLIHCYWCAIGVEPVWPRAFVWGHEPLISVVDEFAVIFSGGVGTSWTASLSSGSLTIDFSRLICSCHCVRKFCVETVSSF